MLTNPPQNVPNVPKFICEICNTKTNNKKDFNKHLSTEKHKKQQKATNSSSKPHKVIRSYLCKCGKKYKERSGLWRHVKKCIIMKHLETNINPNNTNNKINDTNIETPDTNAINSVDTNFVIELLKQNQELQKTIIELSKERTVITNCNNNNKTFNLHVFLNEQCKDALNIGEFVDTIKMQLSDLETTGRLGYVEGVSRIINKNLNELETNKRPIHCSDVKRETLYIKNDNEWIKDDDEKEILKKAVKQIANKNIMQINEWKKANPDCTNSDSKKNNIYLNIVSNSMSGSTKEEQFTNLNKIISKVTKEVVITKE